MSINLKSKRAQITMIFIIGLLILFAVMFLLFIRKNLKPDVKQETNVIYELESGLIKEHISSCIRRVASDALEIVGSNGGVIYDYQGGTIPSGSLVQGKDYIDYLQSGGALKLKYGIRENEYCTDIDYSHPGYPYPNLALATLPALYAANDRCGYGKSGSAYDGVYGEVTLQKLCAANRDSGCQSFAKGDVVGLTIQSQVEDYVSSKLDLCANLTYFNDRFGAQITVQAPASTKIFIRDEDVQVSVTYPLRVVYKNAEPVSRVFEYQASLPVRMGLIYNFIYSTLSMDVRDLNFEVDKQGITSPFFRPGFVFKKLDNPCAGCDYPFSKDDVFEVYDSNSIINGKQYLFRIAIQDRRPAIDLITDKVYDFASSGNQVDAKIEVYARDPDDSEVKYTFMSEGYGSGWRENNDVFQFLTGKVYVDMSLSIYDVGKHKVGVLAKDDAGFFDYQWFILEVKDSSISNPEGEECMEDCTSDPYYNLGSRCVDWCTISTNFCASECVSGFGMGDSNCENCVWPIFDAEKNEAHPSCAAFTKDQCAAFPNDCFWIVEKSLDYSTSNVRCVDDRELHTVERFASIVG